MFDIEGSGEGPDGLLENELREVTLDMIAYLFVPHRDDDISLSVTWNKLINE